jgi:hypothetical protein
MPDTVTERRVPAEQYDEAEGGAEKSQEVGIGFRHVGGGARPRHQEYRADRERDLAHAVQDRPHRDELPAIELQAGR